VEKFCGRELAKQVARALVVEMPRSNQSGYAVLPLSRPHEDDRIREVEEYIAENYANNICIDRLAERANMSPRTFIRRFKAATGCLPCNYLQRQRVAIARVMLECPSPSVQAVSNRVGYEDLAFFRKVFKRETGLTPGEYRAKFCSNSAAAGATAEATESLH
jgi:transcriptional regulator GlxA family with amidase domain